MKRKEFTVNELMEYLNKIPVETRDFVRITIIANDKSNNDGKSLEQSIGDGVNSESQKTKGIMTVSQTINDYFKGTISKNKLYDMVRKEEIPVVRISSRKIYFDSEELDKWIKQKK